MRINLFQSLKFVILKKEFKIKRYFLQNKNFKNIWLNDTLNLKINLL